MIFFASVCSASQDALEVKMVKMIKMRKVMVVVVVKGNTATVSPVESNPHKEEWVGFHCFSLSIAHCSDCIDLESKLDVYYMFYVYISAATLCRNNCQLIG